MNEHTQREEDGEEIFRDSKENWVVIVLFFDKPRFDAYRDIVLRVVPEIRNLKKRGKIEKWHFRFGSYGCGPDVSFRLKSGTEYRSEVHKYVKELAEKLKQERLIQLFSFVDPKWIRTDEAIPTEQGYGSWRNWHLTTLCDEFLSETVYTIMTHPDIEESKRLFHDAVIHELFNMFAKQELHCFYDFKRGEHRELFPLLNDQSVKNYAVCLFGKGYDSVFQIAPQRSVFFYDLLEVLDAICRGRSNQPSTH